MVRRERNSVGRNPSIRGTSRWSGALSVPYISVSVDDVSLRRVNGARLNLVSLLLSVIAIEACPSSSANWLAVRHERQSPSLPAVGFSPRRPCGIYRRTARGRVLVWPGSSSLFCDGHADLGAALLV